MSTSVPVAYSVLRQPTLFPRQYKYCLKASGPGLNNATSLSGVAARHTPFREAATLEDRVVIDLSSMPHKGLANDFSSITVSPAAKWDDLYEQLDPLNLTVVGGRVAGVGVGGLVLGCGISYVSARHGLACENVENFEVVLASGDIVNANAHEHRELFKGLRGGSNNLGIVTAITLRTHSQGPFWGGQTFHKIDQRKEIFQALETLIGEYDEFSHFLTTMVINGQMRSWFMGNSYQYTHSLPPVPLSSRPQPFEALLDLKRNPVFPGTPSDTLRIGNMTSYTREYAALLKDKKRWTFATISFGNSAWMMEEFYQLVHAAVKPFLGISSFHLSISYQPLPTLLTSQSQGLNSLGSVHDQGNMFNVHLALGVGNEAAHLDDAITNAVKTLFERAEAQAEEWGLRRDYLPMTYADSWQRPIQRRGKKVVQELMEVGLKYDADGMFQRQVRGGFKLV
ncbi:putative FAD-binding domain, PCMH-type, FAD-binding, type PCMH, subdomain 2 [Septoria linicola]|nr:putative FAD-binding domain, PCMH-type, FAD-binding, type PCMH, subdomain 2 [Septoria linicola]